MALPKSAISFASFFGSIILSSRYLDQPGVQPEYSINLVHEESHPNQLCHKLEFPPADRQEILYQGSRRSMETVNNEDKSDGVRLEDSCIIFFCASSGTTRNRFIYINVALNILRNNCVTNTTTDSRLNFSSLQKVTQYC